MRGSPLRIGFGDQGTAQPITRLHQAKKALARSHPHWHAIALLQASRKTLPLPEIGLARHCIYSSKDHLKESLLAQYSAYSHEANRLWHARQSRMLSRFVAGADMFGSESTGDSVAQQYRELGLNLRAANMDRGAGWSAILKGLGDPEAGILPSLFIHQRCQRLLESLPYLQHDPDRPGDILKTNINEDGVGGDDAADALRYLVATKVPRIYVRKLTGL